MSDDDMGWMLRYTIFSLGGVRKEELTMDTVHIGVWLLSEQEIARTGFGSLLGWDRHLRRHAEGRKSRARLSGGHFIGRLAMHFGLVSDEGLRGMQVVTRELPLIDLHELRRLNIYKRYSKTWTWVALGPERKQGVAAGAHEADKAGQATKEVAPEIPAPAQAHSPPPPALQPCTISQRIERVEEEVHHLRCDVTGLRGVVESFTTEQSKVSTCLISCMTQLMDANGQTYQPFDSTLVDFKEINPIRRIRLSLYGVSRAFSDTINTRLKYEFQCAISNSLYNTHLKSNFSSYKEQPRSSTTPNSKEDIV
ncbi:hypothetical protein Tco_0057781 [Tanacetum coccineum]